MITVRRTSIAATVALVAASALLTGCGADAGDGAGSQPTTASAATTPSSTTGGDTMTPDAAVEQVAQSVVGKTEAEAVAAITSAGYVSRVVERDGVQLPGTMDYRPDRINLAITGGKVTKATVG